MEENIPIKEEADHQVKNIDAVLDRTYHDVEIKLVKIINPNSTTVTFQEHLNQDEIKDATAQFSNGSTNAYDTYESETERIEYVLPPSQTCVQMPFQEQQRTSSCEKRKVSAQNNSRQGTSFERYNLSKTNTREDSFNKSQLIRQSLLSAQKKQPRKQHSSDNSTRYYEVAPGIVITERPLSKTAVNISPDDGRQYQTYKKMNNSQFRERVWTGYRSASSRAKSSVSSKWRMAEPSCPKPNMFIKLPFKQAPIITMESNYKVQDDRFLPGDELRATTAFALSRIRRAIGRMPTPSRYSSRQGRLLKAKLKPLEPVAIAGPNIRFCRGVQPEVHKKAAYSPSPSRQRHLKEQYIEVCNMHKNSALENEYERRRNAHSITSDASIHRTSPQPHDDPDYLRDMYPVNFDKGVQYSDGEDNTSNHDNLQNILGLSKHKTLLNRGSDHHMEREIRSLRLESSVIY